MWTSKESQKLAVASWSYSCFSKGRGRSESNTEIFDSKPPSPLSSQGIFEAVLEADNHGLKSCQAIYIQHIKIPSQSHHVFRLIWTLAFVDPPPLGLKWCVAACIHDRKMSWRFGFLIFWCDSWSTAFIWPCVFVHIGGVGWGGVGHVLTFMWTC